MIIYPLTFYIFEKSSTPSHFNSLISLFSFPQSTNFFSKLFSLGSLKISSCLHDFSISIYSTTLLNDKPGSSSLFFAADITIYLTHQDLAFLAFRIQCAQSVQQILKQANVLNLTFFASTSSTVVFPFRSLNLTCATLACCNSGIRTVHET